MKLPRDLSGVELAKGLCCNFGYEQVHQEGSHIILQTEDPFRHRVAVPAHRSLRVGTLNAILRSVANHKGIERQDILDEL